MRYKGINEHAVKTACFFAFKLSSSTWFRSFEREDIEQELIIEYLINFQYFDESRGTLETFINAIMLNKSRNMVKQRQSEKRGKNCEVPLEWDSDYYDWSEKFDDPVAIFENRFDVDKIMGFLDEHEKALCLCLMQGLSINETIKKLNIGKSKFYRIMDGIKKKIK